MENVSNVSSEEELLQLRNEGKISEDEYEDLRSAMQKSTEVKAGAPVAEKDEKESKRKLGKRAFTLMLVGIIVPVVAHVITGMVVQAKNTELAAINESGGRVSVGYGVYHWYLLGIILEIWAFVTGVIAWPDVYAKATVVTISFVIVLAFLFAIAF